MNVQVEFDQLLEALWDGTLDAEGRRRLESLAAADPILGRRLTAERRLTGLLVECGKRPVPASLAASVFARLDAGEEVSEAPEEEKPAVIVQQRRERPSFWSYFQLPAFRWGVSFALVAIICAQTAYILHQNRSEDVLLPTSPTRIAMVPEPVVPGSDNLEPSQDSQIASAADESAAHSLSADRAVPVPDPTPAPQRTANKVELAAAVPKPDPTPAPERAAAVPKPDPTPAPQVLAAVPAPVVIERPDAAVPKPDPTPAPSESVMMLAQNDAIAEPLEEPVTTPTPATVQPPVATPAPAEPREIRVALQIVLPEAGAVWSPPAGGLPMSINPSGPFPASRGFNGFRTGLAPGAPGAALDMTEAGAPLTRRDIETAISMIGGYIDEIEQVPGYADLWQVRCTVNEAQLAQFMQLLREQNLTQVEFSTASQMQFGPQPTPAQQRSGLDRLRALEGAGITVDRKGPAPTIAEMQAAIAPRDVPPGGYAVLEGESLLSAMGLDQAPDPFAPPQMNNVARQRPIQLILLIQQP